MENGRNAEGVEDGRPPEFSDQDRGAWSAILVILGGGWASLVETGPPWRRLGASLEETAELSNEQTTDPKQ